MRLVLLLALAALAISPAVAQTQFADSSGGYVSLSALSLGYAGVGALGGTVGARFSNGADVGLHLQSETAGTYSRFRVGPVAGITRRLGAGFLGRLEGSVGYTASRGTGGGYRLSDGSFVEPFEYHTRTLIQDASATVSRRIPIVGSVAFQPGVGVYAAARQRLRFDVPGLSETPARNDASAGVQLDLPLTFRLFGRDAAVTPAVRFSLTGAPDLGETTGRGLGFSLNF